MMMMGLLATLGVLAVALVIALLVLMRGGRHGDLEAHLDDLGDHIGSTAQAQERAFERLERELRSEIKETARVSRTELNGGFSQFQQTLATQFTSMTTLQNGKIDGFAQQLGQLMETNDRRFAEVRATIEQRLKDIEANNSAKLEEMRRTVDEKLHATLEQRLGESFKQVSDRLEQVHRGLGEMQTLAAGVGDLKKVLTNVKTRGTWGEVQLEALLEQLLTADQYAKNVATVPKSADRVEFAIKLPGRQEAGSEAVPVWLPIDAKFPREDYERLIECPGARRSAGGRRGIAGAGGADSRRGPHDCGEVCRATAYHRLRAAVPAHRRPVRRSPAPARAHRHAATRVPRDDCRADHADCLAQQLADGLSHARHREALERSVAGARRGEDGVRQVRRRAGEDQVTTRNGDAFDRSRGNAHAGDEPQVARCRGVTGRPGERPAWRRAAWRGRGRVGWL
jgi:hypothetical protein